MSAAAGALASARSSARPRGPYGVAAAALLALLAGCGPPAPAASPPRDLDAEARGAAITFLHCFERDGAECRHAEAPYRGWYALGTLLAVRDHSPVRLLDELPRALRDLADDTVARRTLIGELAARERVAFGGACQVVAVRPLGAPVVALVAAARRRVAELDLGDTETGARLAELGERAAALRDAREARLVCAGGRTLYLVLAPTPDAGWHPVHLGDEPILTGGDAAPGGPPFVVGVPDDAVDPWLPVGEDEL